MKISSSHWGHPGAKRSITQHASGTMTRIKGALRVAWTGLLDRIAPFGYEDEQGFHYGEPRLPHDGADANRP